MHNIIINFSFYPRRLMIRVNNFSHTLRSISGESRVSISCGIVFTNPGNVKFGLGDVPVVIPIHVQFEGEIFGRCINHSAHNSISFYRSRKINTPIFF